MTTSKSRVQPGLSSGPSPCDELPNIIGRSADGFAQFSREFRFEMCKLQNVFRLLAIPLLSILSACSCSSIRLPGYLRRHMSPSVDACDDFYAHACGGWAAAHEDRAYRSQLEQLDHVYHGKLATLLELPAAEGQPRFVQLLRDSYSACRKMQGRFQAPQFVRWLATWGNMSLARGQQPEMDYRRLLLLFDEGFNLHSGSERFFAPAAESELKATREAVHWLLQLQLPWPAGEVEVASSDLQPLTRNQFKRLYHALQPLGVPAQQLWQQVKQLERRLCEAPPQGAATEAESGAESDADSGEVYPLAEHLLPDNWLLPLPLPVALNNASALPAAHWAHYARRLRALLATRPLAQLTRYALLRLLHQLQLRAAPSFGRQECAAQSRHLLAHAAVWLLQQQQSEQERQSMHATLQQLFEQLRRRLELLLLSNRNRFRAATQHFLLDKLQRMRLRVSVLPQADPATQRQLLEAHYASLHLNYSDYYGNLLAILQQIDQWSRDGNRDVASLLLLQPDGFGSYASPYFLPDRNLVMLPLSLLATPLYRTHQATVLSQSALGFLIAHEMTHGFTPTDIHYDGRGNVAGSQQKLRIHRNVRFSNQIRCLRRSHKEMADIDEKFADINGLSLAYETFNATTPLANNSMRQLFFLNFAQFFCQDSSRLEDSPVHGGSRERVNDAVANLESFARAFSCAFRQKHQCRLF